MSCEVKRRTANKLLCKRNPSSQILETYESITISEYQATAGSFREGTWDHDVSQNRDALIQAMPRNPGRILDLGCGPGRDMTAFKAEGHEVIGLDATPAFVEMAKQATGCEVWKQTFLALNLPDQFFDGIFANASLLHVPQVSMVQVLRDLWKALVPQGALVMSMARGDSEGLVSRPLGQRFVSYWEYQTLAPLVQAAGYRVTHHYYRPPHLLLHQQQWIVIVAHKPALA